MTIELRLIGAPDQSLATEASEILAAASGEKPTQRTETAMENNHRGEGIEVLSLILSVPGSILATMAIAEKVHLAERIRTFLAKVKKHDLNATLSVDEKRLDLSGADADSVLNVFATAPRRDQPPKEGD